MSSQYRNKTESIVKKILLLSWLLSFTATCFTHTNTTITILGTGYVGLVTGACLADISPNNTKVICADIDEKKIRHLNNNHIPIYEKDLEEIVTRNISRETLLFTYNIPMAIQQADIVIIAVGTPTNNDGVSDLSYFKSALKTIAQNLTETTKIIVIKSTVPIGTCNKIPAILDRYNVSPKSYKIVFNPEFLREGTAVQDFMNTDRIVIGTKSKKAIECMKMLYQPFIDKQIPFIVTDPTSAEIVKYASNNFLALKLSFINEIANLCDATNGDIATITQAVGLDPRINPHFLQPGPGFGGSCLPKDTLALTTIAKKYKVPLQTIDAAIKANKYQKKLSLKKLKTIMPNIEGKTVAILGLAFKADTDDIRYSPAIPLIKKLVKQKTKIKVYDPAAMENMKHIFPDITYCSTSYDAIKESDALIILTDWQEFKQLDIEKISTLMSEKIIVDMRNILSTKEMNTFLFRYATIGNHQY